jgi:hypothetical protein
MEIPQNPSFMSLPPDYVPPQYPPAEYVTSVNNVPQESIIIPEIVSVPQE